jgi:hypothetical protein
MIRTPRCRQPTWAIDTMNVPSGRPLIYALTLWMLAQPLGYAAAAAVSAGEGAPVTDVARRGQSALAAGGSRREGVRRDDPGQGVASRRGEATTHHGDSVPAALRRVNAPAHAGAGLSKHAVVAAPGYPIRRQTDYGRAAVAPGVTSAAKSAGWPRSTVPAVANRPPATLKAVAGNGVIGGARGAGAGWLGGPANTRTAIKGGIDGSALRRRS